MRAAALALLLLASCSTARSSERQEEIRASLDLWAREHGDRHETSEERVTRAPVVTATEGLLTIPPGSVIDTPAGKVELPKSGPPATISFKAKEKAGPVNESKTSGADEKVDKQAGAKAAIDQKAEAHEKKATDVTGLSFSTKLAIAGAVLVALLLALVVVAVVYRESPVGKLLGKLLRLTSRA